MPLSDSSEPSVIVVVDDNEDDLFFAQKALTGLGFEVLSARNGADALRTIVPIKHLVRAVLTDLSMPHMDGLELSERLRASTFKRKIVIMSDDIGRFSHERLTEHATSYFQKAGNVADMKVLIAAKLLD